MQFSPRRGTADYGVSGCPLSWRTWRSSGISWDLLIGPIALFFPASSPWRPASQQRRQAVAFWVVVFLYYSIYTLKIIHRISSGPPRNSHHDQISGERRVLQNAHGGQKGKSRSRKDGESFHDAGWTPGKEMGDRRTGYGASRDCGTVLRKIGPGRWRECLTKNCSSEELCTSQERTCVKPAPCPVAGTDPQEAQLSLGSTGVGAGRGLQSTVISVP